ncbi:hypothetical protein GCM10010193_16720 [Kitasatospora atroaurantiaca]
MVHRHPEPLTVPGDKANPKDDVGRGTPIAATTLLPARRPSPAHLTLQLGEELDHVLRQDGAGRVEPQVAQRDSMLVQLIQRTRRVCASGR